MRTLFYICSRLLTYPNSALLSSLSQLRNQAESLPEGKYLLMFIDYLSNTDPIKLQESYVQTFDFSEDRNLYLSYSMFGVSMERGSELLRLKNLYAGSGMEDNGKELPDYLPTFLRFLSLAEENEYKELLTKYRASIINLARNVAKASSPYSLVFDALVEAIGGEV